MNAASKRQAVEPEAAVSEALLSPHVEASALGSVFLDDAAYYEMVAIGLTEEYFWYDSHKRIFRAMQRLCERREKLSIVALCDELERAKSLEAVGGAAYISSLIDGVAESDQTKQYVRILRDKYLRRRMTDMATTVTQCAADPSDSILSTISHLHDDLLKIQGGTEKASYAIAEFGADVLAKIESQMYSEREIVGLPFGIAKLDEDTTGIRETEIVVIGGYPGCVAPETKIEGVPIAERADQELATLFGRVRPLNPFLKGRADLYEVLTRSGSRIVVTIGHRFLAPTGWCRLRDLSVGSLIAGDGSERDSIGLGRRLNSQGYCCNGFHRNDGLRLPAQVAYQYKLRQLRKTACGNSASPSSSLRLSRNCFSIRERNYESQALLQFLSVASKVSRSDWLPLLHERSLSRWFPGSLQKAHAWRSLPLEGRTSSRDCLRDREQPYGAIGLHGYEPRLCENVQTFGAVVGAEDRSRQHLVHRESDSVADLAFWDEIVSVKFVRNGQFYDLHVPSYNHYSAEGLWHHNSGKSSFACHIARINAMRRTKVGVFSIEMTKDQLLHRLWAQSSDIPYSYLRNPKNLPGADLARLKKTVAPQVDKLPIFIDDTAKNIKEIIPRAYLWVKRDDVGLIVLDFLQRVHAPGKSEYDIVSYSIDALTEFAKITGVPIIVLSQLTRAEDKKKAANTVPTMQQLRSSGRIEQNAHLILFTHRPEDDEGNPTGEDLIVIAKQRAGKKGRIKCEFDGQSQRWGERPGAVAETERMVWRD